MTPISLTIAAGLKNMAKSIMDATEEPIIIEAPEEVSDTIQVVQEEKPLPFQGDAFRRGILESEVGGKLNYKAMNPQSTATGAYQILYSQAKKWLPEHGYSNITTREGFANSPEAQEAYMTERINTYVNKDASDLTARYKPQLGDKWTYTTQDVAALSHFLGRRGTMNYFAAVRDGRDPKSVLPAHAINLPPDEYLRRFRKGYQTYFDNK